jgi:hypothetical protein
MVMAITGSPGTGKTWILRQLKNIFKKEIILCATTGMAAYILKNNNGEQIAKTCHNYFRQTPNKNYENNIFRDCWNINDKRRICYNYKILCIDEASMVSKKMIDWIRKFYPNYTIVLIGDPDQFPMIKDDTNNEDWQDIEFDYHYKLIGNHRIKDGLLEALLEALLNNDINLVSSIIRPRMIEKETALQETIKALWITYTNKARIEINKETKSFVGMRIIADLYKSNKAGGKFIDDSLDIPFIQQNNIYKIYSHNTETGLFIIGEENNSERFGISVFDLINHFIPAQSITAHKCQGQTLSKIIVDFDDILDRPVDIVFNELYVCFSRVASIEDITFVKSNKAIYFKNPKRKLKCITDAISIDNESLLNELKEKFISLLKKETEKKCPVCDIRLDEMRDTFSIRKLSNITGIPKSTIERMLKKGLTQKQIIEHYTRIENTIGDNADKTDSVNMASSPMDNGDDKIAHNILKSVAFYESIFGINADYEKMNEVLNDFCLYEGLEPNMENRCKMKYYLYENIEPQNLLGIYLEIENEVEKQKYMKRQMIKDLYGTNNKKRSIPHHTPQAQDLIDGKIVKGQDLYNALKVLNWCRYSREEGGEIIVCLKSQKAKSGNRYNEATNIIRKYWNIWTCKNNT